MSFEGLPLARNIGGSLAGASKWKVKIMATILGALIGAFSVAIAAIITAIFTRRTQDRRHTAEQSANAIIELFRALASNSEAWTHLNDPTFDPSGSDVKYWQQQIADSRIRSISAKMTLTTFSSQDVCLAASDALSGNLNGRDPRVQANMCYLVQSVRKDLYPREPEIPIDKLASVMYGEEAQVLKYLKTTAKNSYADSVGIP